MNKKVKTKFVKFRGEIVALFPEIKRNEFIMSYQHMGQHGEANKDLLNCPRATRTEARELRKELVSIGYRLSII